MWRRAIAPLHTARRDGGKTHCCCTRLHFPKFWPRRCRDRRECRM